LPPPAHWAGRVRGLSERLGLARYRQMPDLTPLAGGSRDQRIAIVRYAARLANAAFDRMGPAAGGGDEPFLSREARLDLFEEEYREKLKLCTAAEKAAFLQYRFAEAEIAGAHGGDGQKPPGDVEAYQWLRDHDSFEAGRALPKNFDTWARYLRRARQKLGERKNKPRRGRTGRSIAHPDELDSHPDEGGE
ncbi:MAG: hypothetical protein J2P46_21375, partial [Zavarzinella sp.]|nr:hypothetical protein [Zavarzinella sp.]